MQLTQNNQDENFRKKIIQTFLRNVIVALENKLTNKKNWEVLVEVGLLNGKAWSLLSIKQDKESKLGFGFEFQKNNFQDPIFGIVRLDEAVDLAKLRLNYQNEMAKNGFISNNWWLARKDYCSGDILKKIISDGDKAVDNFVDTFMEVFDKYQDIVIKCNEELSKKNKS